MRISVIGTGYVGLVTGIGLASLGHQVICVDVDIERIRAISQGKSPVYEKGLGELLKSVLDVGHFSATIALESAVLNSEVTFICVGTPTTVEGNIDLSQVKAASIQIGTVLQQKETYHLVVVKSTVAPGTSLEVILSLIKESSGKSLGEFGLCVNPEFLREGNAIEDFMNPDRIIIGEFDKRSGELLAEVYSCFDVPILRTSPQTAEMIKYANNALLGSLISFSNEIANICERTPNVDVVDVLNAICLDKRLNPTVGNKLVNPQILTYLMAGCGFGGSCLPKDISALVSFSKARGYDPKLLPSVLSINEKQPVHLVELAQKELGNLDGKRVAVLGLAFKPDTDDLRGSPAIPIIRELIKRKAIVSVYDPGAMKNAESFFQDLGLDFCCSVGEAIRGADACLLVTKWDEFKKITPELLMKEMSQPILVDGRRLLNSKDFHGKVKYIGIGYTEIKPD
jgi:UDPglucose 6-dehydrogenase/GDP-mannose 6-dehydrogenase